MTVEDAFFEIHKDIPRQAPGSDVTTQKMLDVVLEHTAPANALDIGCGPGRSSLVIARNGIHVTALDIHQPFLDKLSQQTVDAGLEDRIEPVNKSMTELDFSESSFDLIWAEGSAYIVGWKNALSDWKRLVGPQGFIVASECCWLTDAPSQENKDFWNEAYPTMLTKERAAQMAEVQGYEVVEIVDFTDEDWWGEYYASLEKNQERLDKVGASEEMQTALTISKKEIEVRRKYGDEYNYVGFILRKVQ